MKTYLELLVLNEVSLVVLSLVLSNSLLHETQELVDLIFIVHVLFIFIGTALFIAFFLQKLPYELETSSFFLDYFLNQTLTAALRLQGTGIVGRYVPIVISNFEERLTSTFRE